MFCLSYGICHLTDKKSNINMALLHFNCRNIFFSIRFIDANQFLIVQYSQHSKSGEYYLALTSTFTCYKLH